MTLINKTYRKKFGTPDLEEMWAVSQGFTYFPNIWETPYKF